MRLSSQAITRRCRAFSVTSQPKSFSTTSAQPRFMFIPAR